MNFCGPRGVVALCAMVLSACSNPDEIIRQTLVGEWEELGTHGPVLISQLDSGELQLALKEPEESLRGVVLHGIWSVRFRHLLWRYQFPGSEESTSARQIISVADREFTYLGNDGEIHSVTRVAERPSADEANTARAKDLSTKGLSQDTSFWSWPGIVAIVAVLVFIGKLVDLGLRRARKERILKALHRWEKQVSHAPLRRWQVLLAIRALRIWRWLQLAATRAWSVLVLVAGGWFLRSRSQQVPAPPELNQSGRYSHIGASLRLIGIGLQRLVQGVVFAVIALLLLYLPSILAITLIEPEQVAGFNQFLDKETVLSCPEESSGLGCPNSPRPARFPNESHLAKFAAAFSSFAIAIAFLFLMAGYLPFLLYVFTGLLFLPRAVQSWIRRFDRWLQSILPLAFLSIFATCGAVLISFNITSPSHLLDYLQPWPRDIEALGSLIFINLPFDIASVVVFVWILRHIVRKRRKIALYLLVDLGASVMLAIALHWTIQVARVNAGVPSQVSLQASIGWFGSLFSRSAILSEHWVFVPVLLTTLIPIAAYVLVILFLSIAKPFVRVASYVCGLLSEQEDTPFLVLATVASMVIALLKVLRDWPWLQLALFE